MEIIRKKISLEPFKSHINGVLPFIGGSGSTNFGKFVYDNSGIRTCEMMRRYNYLLEIIRRSLHLKRLANVNKCGMDEGAAYNKYYPDFNYVNTTEHFIFNEDIGVYKVDDFTVLNGGKFYVNKNDDVTHEYVVLVSDTDWDTYYGYGGIDGLRQINEIIYHNSNNFVFDKIPYIPIPILLTCEYADVGIMTTYYDWFGEKTFKNGNTKEWYEVNITGLTTSGTGFGIESSGLTPVVTDVSDRNIKMETKIHNLRVEEYFTDDNGNVLQGIFKTYSDGNGKFFKCTYNGSEWVFSEYNGNDLKCGDDEGVTAGAKKYRTFTLKETVKTYLDSLDADSGDIYYFLIRYDNSEDTPMEIPYVENVVVNKDYSNGAYTGDYIKHIVAANGIITFEYVIGAVFTSDDYSINTSTGGTIYFEEYNYYPKTEASVDIDGFEGVKYWYNYIDFDNQKEYVYNEAFNLERNANISDVKQLVIGDVWRKDGTVLNTPVFKEEYLMGVSADSNIDINVEVDRGNAAAFERHLRLCECNTMQDLEEIANGSFFE